MNKNQIDQALNLGLSFDLIATELNIASQNASLYFIDGFIKDEVMEKILEYVLNVTPEQLNEVENANEFAKRFLPYVEISLETSLEKLIPQILSGTSALWIESFNEVFLIDARTYPARGPREPEDDRVLRGARDGFVETLIFNTALIRRRLRDPHLVNQYFQVGSESKSDVVLSYMTNKVDPIYLAKIQSLLTHLQVENLTMAQESLAECLLPKQNYNPFPRIRYTERCDAATACIVEGKIIIIVDNSPSVMILPTSFFDFIQETNDFYFPAFVGTYLRWVRILIFITTLFLTPLWFLLISNPDRLPSWLTFIQVKEPNSIPVLIQLLIIELVIDGLKMASLNTPSSLSGSFSVIGALIMGDFAVKAQWFVPEVVLYMAFVAISNFTQPSFELGYAFKFMRVMLLILTGLFNTMGFLLGILIMIILLAKTKTVADKNYLYPLIPFNKSDLKALIFRLPIHFHK